MKTILITLLTLLLAATPMTAQDNKDFDIGGVGLGSRGVNFRSDPDTRYGLLIRSGFGAGVASSFRMTDQEFSIAYGLFVPVGLELFPIAGNERLSVSLETGLNYLQSKGVKSTFGHYGLIEFTWYLRSARDSETKY